MSSHPFPGRDTTYESLPDNEEDRHEALVELFGRYLMWLRQRNIELTERLVVDSAARLKLGAIQRRPFEKASELAANDRDSAILLAETSADRLIRSFLHFLTHEGSDFPLGEDHHVRFRLEVEIVRNRDDEVVTRDVVNRGGAKCLYEYWGRWINRFTGGVAPAQE